MDKNCDDIVLEPFLGSGTTLRVCQQLNRNGIGFELNPDFVQMTKERLNKPFTSFDSIDERMERVPLDLRDKWFLQHHNGSIDKFTESVEEIYGDKKLSKKINNHFCSHLIQNN